MRDARLARGTYDLVLLLAIVEHVDDPRAAGLEVARAATMVTPVNWVYPVHNVLADYGAPRRCGATPRSVPRPRSRRSRS